MNHKIFYIILAAILAMVLGIVGVAAQGPSTGETDPQEQVGNSSLEPEKGEEVPLSGADISTTANVGSKINYQGVLLESNSPVTGNRDMTFLIYSDNTCSTLEDTIAKPNVAVSNGIFGVVLDITPSDFNGQELYLTVQVGGVAIITCQEIVPVPYALSLRPRATINGSTASANQGILNIISSNGRGVRVTSAGTDGINVDSAVFDGYQVDDAGDNGVEVNSAGGDGLNVASATDDGVDIGNAGSNGVEIDSANTGIYVGSASNTGIYVASASNNGVWVNSANNNGVIGTSDYSGGAGVWGINNSTGWAGYFSGKVTITGNLSKGGGSFKIDHPLDPENKYLYHSFVESPDMMNVYNGNVILNNKGEAWVELPEWFEALNKEFRYQLTPIGAPGPNLYIAEEIKNNRFKVAGGEPNAKISWQVTGIRHDPYAEQNRIVVEEDKPTAEQGTYLHPTAYGQPVSKGLDFARLQELKEGQ